MTRSMRLWLAVALVSACILAPVAAGAITVDEYAYNSMKGTVGLKYEKTDTKSGRYTRSSSSFNQTYSLDFKGRILSRNLMIYNVGVILAKDVNERAHGRSGTDLTRYYLTTTLLPRSRIPLTLYVRRFDTEKETSTSQSSSRRTIYGFKWLGNFRTLPKTRLSYERSKDERLNSTSTSDSYQGSLEKDIGPSKNNAQFSRTQSGTEGTGRHESSQTNISFRNNTDVSRNTKFDSSASRYATRSDASSGIANNTVTLELRSKPSAEFNQSHSYNFMNSSADSAKTDGHFYSGAALYSFDKRFGAGLSMVSNNSTARINESKTSSEGLSTAGNANYTGQRYSAGLNAAKTESVTHVDGVKHTSDSYSTGTNVGIHERRYRAGLSASKNSSVTRIGGAKYTSDSYYTSANASVVPARNFSLGESVSFSKSYTNAPYTNTSFSAITTLSHSKSFTLVSASAAANVGYTEQKINDLTGMRGISRGITLSAMGTQLSRILTLSANASYTETENKTDNKNDKNYTANITSSNTIWSRYVNLYANLTRQDYDSWLEYYNTKGETRYFSASTSYFSWTTLNLTADSSMYYGEATGMLKNSSKDISFSRPFIVFKSRLNTSINRSVNESSYPGGRQKRINVRYSLGYSKTLTGKRLTFNASADRTESKVEKATSITGRLTAGIAYKLRSWSIAADYSYGIQEAGIQKSSDSRYMLSLSRGFGITY